MPPLPPGVLLRAFDQTVEAVVITDADLDAPGPRYLYVNAGFERMTGYPSAEVLGRSPRMLQGPKTDRAVLSRLRANLTSGQRFAGETTNYRRDGSEFLLRWSIAPVLDERGVTTHFVASQRDVTEERRLESVASSLNLADHIGLVFAGVSHELGNPVHSLKASLSLVRRDLATMPGEKVARSLDRMMSDVERVEGLLRELKSYSAFERQTIDRLPLSAFLGAFEDLLRSSPGEQRSDRVVFEFAPDLPSVMASRRALHQVLLNLLGNALDALPDGGGRVVVAASRRGQWVQLSVDDDGVGMSADVLRRAMSPFFTTKSKGTGLGLSIVRRLCADMGAPFRLESHPGRGTIAIVELPVEVGA